MERHCEQKWQSIPTSPFSPGPTTEEQSWAWEAKTKLPTFQTIHFTTRELQAEASPARPRMVDAIISQPFEVSARNICCHYHVWLGQQHPPEEDRTLCAPPSLRHCQRAGSREWGASPSWSNFTHWFFSINKLVTFAPHLAGRVSNNTLIPSENMNHWHTGGSGYLPPLSTAKDPTH